MKTHIAILAVFFFAKTAAQNSSDIAGKITTENNNEMLKIKATVKNNSAIHYDLNYVMVSVKKGKAGNSSNKQSGKFSIKPNEIKILSENAIKVTKKDALKVFLFVKDEHTNKVLSKDSLEVNADQFKDDVSYIPENRVELTGLTVDDTKTRMGQAFYESFFKKYSQFNKKYEGTITVSELPSFGRSSRILIMQNDQVIYSFQSKPDEESLDAESDKALALLMEYNSQNSLRNRDFKY